LDKRKALDRIWKSLFSHYYFREPVYQYTLAESKLIWFIY